MTIDILVNGAMTALVGALCSVMLIFVCREGKTDLPSALLLGALCLMGLILLPGMWMH